MIMRLKILALTFVFATFSGWCHADKIKILKKEEARIFKPLTIDESFIAPRYAGLDAASLYKYFKTITDNLKKEQYETSEEHKFRVAKNLEDFSNISNQLYALKMDFVTVDQYNADEQEYKVNGWFLCRVASSKKVDDEQSLSGKKRRYCKVKFITNNSYQYVGRNAMGVAVKVDKRRSHTFSLAIDYKNNGFDSWFEKENGGYISFKGRITVPIEAARKIKNKEISTIFVGKFNDPVLHEGSAYYSKPEITRPYDTLETTEGVNFDLTNLLFVVRDTGEILANITVPPASEFRVD